MFHAFVCYVAPRAGAWIETTNFFIASGDVSSLPARERGLKRGRIR